MQKLLEEYVPRVYRFALRLTGSVPDAEDVTQETFLRAWANRRKLKHPGAARVWLFRIAVNLWKDELRRKRNRTDHGDFPNRSGDGRCGTARRTRQEHRQPASDVGGVRRAVAQSPGQIVETREQLEQALQALDGLPDRQREVLYLTAVEELSTAEVAGILQISLGAVRTNLSLARKKMRERLRPDALQ